MDADEPPEHDPQRLFVLEPARLVPREHSSDAWRDPLSMEVVTYLAPTHSSMEHAETDERFGGTIGNEEPPSEAVGSFRRGLRGSSSKPPPKTPPSFPRPLLTYRVLIVHDKARCDSKKAGASISDAEKDAMYVEILEWFNGAQDPFKTLTEYSNVDLQVVIAGQMDWCDGNQPYALNAGEKFQFLEDIPGKISDWVSANRDALPRHHLVFIATAADMVLGEDDVGGYAHGYSACHSGSTVVVAETLGYSVLAGVGLTLHEVGHTFGFGHDMYDYGLTACKNQDTIMATWLDGVPIKPSRFFSTCCKSLFREHYLNGRYKCLETTPSFECGNGVLDPGEACDCGAIDCSSSDPCCDGKTCQLVSGAACSDVASAPAFAPLSRAVFDTVDADALASQTCCQSCQIKVKGTTCRAARENDQCDVAETCDGVSAACPADSGAALGTACEDANGDRGACYDGTCVNREYTCQMVTAGAQHGGVKFSTSLRADLREYIIDHFDQQGRWSANPLAPRGFEPGHCAEPLVCFWNATRDEGFYYSTYPGRNVPRGFPCGPLSEDGKTYSALCDGGSLSDQFAGTFAVLSSSPAPSRCVETALMASSTPPPPSPPPPGASRGNYPPSPPPSPPPAPPKTATAYLTLAGVSNWSWNTEWFGRLALRDALQASGASDADVSWTGTYDGSQPHHGMHGHRSFDVRSAMTFGSGVAYTAATFPDDVFATAVEMDLVLAPGSVTVTKKTDLFSRRRAFRRALVSVPLNDDARDGISPRRRGRRSLLQSFAGLEVVYVISASGFFSDSTLGINADRTFNNAWRLGNRTAVSAEFERVAAVIGSTPTAGSTLLYDANLEIEVSSPTLGDEGLDAIEVAIGSTTFIAMLETKLAYWGVNFESVTQVAFRENIYHPPASQPVWELALIISAIIVGSLLVLALIALCCIRFGPACLSQCARGMHNLGEARRKSKKSSSRVAPASKNGPGAKASGVARKR